MKHSKLFSLFVFGLLFTGFAQAQDMERETRMMPEPKMMMEEDMMPPMDMEMMMREEIMMHDEMEKMEREHEGCMSEKKGGCGSEKGECPMKKMMREHHGGSMFLMKALCAAGMLVFLFLGAFVVRKGWEFKGFCKKCKK